MFSTNRTTLTHAHIHTCTFNHSLTQRERESERERGTRTLHSYSNQPSAQALVAFVPAWPVWLFFSLLFALSPLLSLSHVYLLHLAALDPFPFLFILCVLLIWHLFHMLPASTATATATDAACVCVLCVCMCACVTSFIELCLAAVTSMPTWFMLLLLPLALLLQALVLLQLFVVHLVVVVLLGGKINITFFFFGKCATQLFQLCCLLHLIALLLGQVKSKPKSKPQSSLTSCVIVRFTTLASTWKLMQLLAKRCKTFTCRSTGYKENWAMYCWALLATLILIIRHSTAYLQLFLQ